jgi:hypothetical protein
MKHKRTTPKPAAMMIGEATAEFVRDVALALPGTEERHHMGSPSFRVTGKIFAQLTDDGRVALVKLSPLEQAELCAHHPDRFWTPEHWAKFGWTYVRIAGTEMADLRLLVERSWARVAPKNLTKARKATPAVPNR